MSLGHSNLPGSTRYWESVSLSDVLESIMGTQIPLISLILDSWAANLISSLLKVSSWMVLIGIWLTSKLIQSLPVCQSVPVRISSTSAVLVPRSAMLSSDEIWYH